MRSYDKNIFDLLFLPINASPSSLKIMKFFRQITPNDLASAKIGLALGSGAARGLSHIGVLQTLNSLGIRPHCIAGTSIGGLIGAIYTAGRLDDYAQRIKQWTRKDTLNILDPVLPRSGLIEGNKLIAFHTRFLEYTLFEQCRIPLATIMTDARTGEEVVSTTGPLSEALRGTIAVPGFITPAQFNGRIFLDGGLVNPLPVDICRAMGADLVIAVDVNSKFIKNKIKGKSRRGRSFLTQRDFLASWATRMEEHDLFPTQFFKKIGRHHQGDPKPEISLFEVISNTFDIMENALKESRLAKDPPDILLRPDTRQISFLDVHLAREAIAAGEKSVVMMMEKIGKNA